MVTVPPDPHKSQNNQYSVAALEKTVLHVIRRVGCQFIAKYIFFVIRVFWRGGDICHIYEAVGVAKTVPRTVVTTVKVYVLMSATPWCAIKFPARACFRSKHVLFRLIHNTSYGFTSKSCICIVWGEDQKSCKKNENKATQNAECCQKK